MHGRYMYANSTVNPVNWYSERVLLVIKKGVPLALVHFCQGWCRGCSCSSPGTGWYSARVRPCIGTGWGWAGAPGIPGDCAAKWLRKQPVREDRTGQWEEREQVNRGTAHHPEHRQGRPLKENLYAEAQKWNVSSDLTLPSRADVWRTRPSFC
jgi:hypothetical protein